MSRNSKKTAVPFSLAGILVICLILFFQSDILPFDNSSTETGNSAASNPSGVSSPSLLTEAQIYYIDVGQGDSELIRLKEKDGDSFDILIDAGTRSTKQELSDYLRQLGVQDIDILIGTHPHEDHIGGMAQIIQDFPVNALYLPETSDDMTPTTKTYENLLNAVEEKNLSVYAGKAGQTILDSENVSMTILSPFGTDYKDLNLYSIVTRLTVGNTSFLFEGDAEMENEEEILESNADISCDVIKLGHHGSSTSSLEEYIKAAAPEDAVISCGIDNDYGHPHKETLDLMEKLGINIYRTDQQKTLLAKTDGNNISWETGLYSVIDAAS